MKNKILIILICLLTCFENSYSMLNHIKEFKRISPITRLLTQQPTIRPFHQQNSKLHEQNRYNYKFKEQTHNEEKLKSSLYGALALMGAVSLYAVEILDQIWSGADSEETIKLKSICNDIENIQKLIKSLKELKLTDSEIIWLNNIAADTDKLDIKEINKKLKKLIQCSYIEQVHKELHDITATIEMTIPYVKVLGGELATDRLGTINFKLLSANEVKIIELIDLIEDVKTKIIELKNMLNKNT